MQWCQTFSVMCVRGDRGRRATTWRQAWAADSLSQKPNQANALWTSLVSASKLWCLFKLYTVILAVLVIQSPPFLVYAMLGIKHRALLTLGMQSTYWALPRMPDCYIFVSLFECRTVALGPCACPVSAVYGVPFTPHTVLSFGKLLGVSLFLLGAICFFFHFQLPFLSSSISVSSEPLSVTSTVSLSFFSEFLIF